VQWAGKVIVSRPTLPIPCKRRLVAGATFLPMVVAMPIYHQEPAILPAGEALAPRPRPWLLHNHGRYGLVPPEGKFVVFEYSNNNCRGMAKGMKVVSGVRQAKGWACFFAGERMRS
jgi:hypothetical protein